MQCFNVEPGSAQWEELHKTHITGTDIAPLMLKKELRPKWMDSRVEVFLRKRGQMPKKAETAAMRRGVAMEDPTAQRYARRTGYSVYRMPMICDGHFAANIDRLVGMPDAPAFGQDGMTVTAKKLCEIKTASRAWGDQPPMYYYGQPQWYMGFLPTVDSADLVCWFGDMVKNVKEGEPDEDFAIYNLVRNQAFIDEAREVATEFMEKFVIPGVFPEVESEEEARIKWAVSNNGLDAVTATKEVEQALAEIHRLDEQVEALTNAREEHVAAVMKAMGEHPVLNDANGNMLVSWKSGKCRETVDYKGLLKKYGQAITSEQIREFTKVAEKPSRPFKIVA